VIVYLGGQPIQDFFYKTKGNAPKFYDFLYDPNLNNFQTSGDYLFGLIDFKINRINKKNE